MEKIFLSFIFFFQFLAGETVTYPLDGIANPQQLIWKDISTAYIVSDGDIFQLDTLTKDLSLIGNRDTNEFVGIDEEGDIELCEIQHFLIDSVDDYSTIFTIDGKELKFFETIRPIYLHDDLLIAVTALDFLEQHYYKISISTGEKEEIFPNDEEEKKESGIYIQEDIFGNISVSYNIREIVNTIIPILKANLSTMLNNIPKNVPHPAFND